MTARIPIVSYGRVRSSRHDAVGRHAARARGARGGILVVVVLLIAVIALPLAIAQGGAARNELVIAHGDALSSQALAIAEAGLGHAYALVKYDANGFNDELNGGGSTGGTGGALSGIGAGADQVLEDGRNYRFVAFGGSASDGYYVRADDNFDETSGSDNPAVDLDNTVLVTSRGRINGAERVVTAAISLGTPVGIYGTASVNLSAATTTDSYPGGVYNPLATTHQGNVQSSGAVAIAGAGTAVDGNASSALTVTVSGGATVSGTTANGATPPPVTAPASCSPFSPSAGIVGLVTYNVATGVLSNQFPGVGFSLSPGTYCFSSITLTGGATLTVTGATRIVLTNGANMAGGSLVNTTFDAHNLEIDGVGNAPIALAGGLTSYVYVNAPAADITVTGSAPLFGAILGANVTIGGAPVHIDTTLRNSARMSGWHEVRG